MSEELLYREFSNGLKVTALPINDVETVSVGFLVGAGARMEDDKEAGCSRILEFWIWNRFIHRESQMFDIASLLADWGANKKSSPNVEWSRFWTTVTADHLEGVLDVFSQVVSAEELSKESFQACQTAAVQFALARAGDAKSYCLDLLREKMAGSNPVGRSAIGKPSQLKQLAASTVQEAYENYYVPSNCVVAIAGKFSEERLWNMMESRFGKWKSKNSSFKEYTPPQWSGCITAEERETQHVHLGVGIPCVAHDDPCFFPFAVLTQALGGGDGSRLFEEIRQRQGLVYQVRGSLSSFRDSGLLMFYLGTRPETVPQVLDALHREIAQVQKKGISEYEVHMAKNQLLNQMVMRSESTIARMHTLLTATWYPNYPRTLHDLRKAIERVTVKDIQHALEAYPLAKVVGYSSVGPIAMQELKTAVFT